MLFCSLPWTKKRLAANSRRSQRNTPAACGDWIIHFKFCFGAFSASLQREVNSLKTPKFQEGTLLTPNSLLAMCSGLIRMAALSGQGLLLPLRLTLHPTSGMKAGRDCVQQVFRRAAQRCKIPQTMRRVYNQQLQRVCHQQMQGERRHLQPAVRRRGDHNASVAGQRCAGSGQIQM